MSGPGVPSSAPLLTVLPMTFGQALDRVFRLLKGNWKVLLRIALVPSTIMAASFVPLVGFFIGIVQPWRDAPRPAPLAGSVIGLLLVAMVIAQMAMLVAYALYQPAASYAALQADAGESISFRGAYGRAWMKVGRYLWLMMLKGIIAAAPTIVFAAMVGGAVLILTMHGNGHLGPSGAMLLLFPLIILLYTLSEAYMILALIWMAFAFPASIQEDLTAAASIVRSVRLTKGARVRIFLLGAVIYAICYVAALVVECILGLVGGLAVIAGMALHVAMNPWGYIGIGIALMCLLAFLILWVACSSAAYSVAFAVLYRNQRMCEQGMTPLGDPTPA